MNIETKKVLRIKIASLDSSIALALEDEEKARKVYESYKLNRQTLQAERQKIKEDLPE